MKAMISQPMGGRNAEEILAVRDAAKAVLNRWGYEVVDTFFNDNWEEKNVTDDVKNKPLFYLAKSLEEMSTVDVVYFVHGWPDARGCRIEHKVAVDYGLQIIYE